MDDIGDRTERNRDPHRGATPTPRGRPRLGRPARPRHAAAAGVGRGGHLRRAGGDAPGRAHQRRHPGPARARRRQPGRCGGPGHRHRGLQRRPAGALRGGGRAHRATRRSSATARSPGSWSTATASCPPLTPIRPRSDPRTRRDRDESGSEGELEADEVDARPGRPVALRGPAEAEPLVEPVRLDLDRQAAQHDGACSRARATGRCRPGPAPRRRPGAALRARPRASGTHPRPARPPRTSGEPSGQNVTVPASWSVERRRPAARRRRARAAASSRWAA